MKAPSPLLVWKLLFVFVLAIGAVLNSVDPMPAVFEKRDDKFQTFVKSIKFNERESGVLFFGNSLMARAMPPSRKKLSTFLENELRKKNLNFKRISAIEVTTGGIGPSWLHAVADELIRAKPAILVLQCDMFVQRSRPVGKEAAATATRLAQWSGVLNLRLLGSVQQRKQKPDAPFLQSNQQQAEQKLMREELTKRKEITVREMWSDQIASADSPVFISGKQLVQKFEETGIEVVIVELPVSETAARIASHNYLKQRSAVLQQLVDIGATVIAYPNILADDHFTDYRHMNWKGRREFLEWFGPAVAQKLAES